jgi:imidazolonepropionase-like amidohydrolase
MLIRADAVLPGGGAPLVRSAAVRVERGFIVAVDIREALRPLPDEVCIELPGATILPGLIDAHDHLQGDRPDAADPGAPTAASVRALVAGQACLRHLEQGVTSVRVLGVEPGLDAAMREAIADGTVDAPRIHSAGQALAAQADDRNVSVGVADVADAHAAVMKQVATGAEVIKLMGSGGIVAISKGVDPGAAGLSPPAAFCSGPD